MSVDRVTSPFTEVLTPGQVRGMPQLRKLSTCNHRPLEASNHGDNGKGTMEIDKCHSDFAKEDGIRGREAKSVTVYRTDSLWAVRK